MATPPATLGTLHVARTRPFGTAAPVAGAGVLGHVVVGWWRPVPGLSFGWWVLLDVAAHAALLGWGRVARAVGEPADGMRELTSCARDHRMIPVISGTTGEFGARE